MIEIVTPVLWEKTCLVDQESTIAREFHLESRKVADFENFHNDGLGLCVMVLGKTL